MSEPITVHDRVVAKAEVKGTCSGGRLPYIRGGRRHEFEAQQLTAFFVLDVDGWRLAFVSVEGPLIRRDGQPGGLRGWAHLGGWHFPPVPDWLRPWVEHNNPGRQQAAPDVEVSGG